MSRLAAVSAGLAVVLCGGWLWAQGEAAKSTPGIAASRPAMSRSAAVRSATPAAAEKSIEVLGGASSWRMFHCVKPPVIQYDDGVKPVGVPLSWLDWESPDPAQGWQKPDFDDGGWLRGSLRWSPEGAPSLARVCVRGRFEVADPAAVNDLKVRVVFYGGAVLCVNGQEIARQSLAKDAALADPYGQEAFAADGNIVPSAWWAAQKFPKAFEARARKIDAAVPAAALRKGVNVVTIEVVRAPYHKIVDDAVAGKPSLDAALRKDRGTPYALNWATCCLNQVAVTAAGADGLVLHAARPERLQVWNADPLDVVHDTDVGDALEPRRPIVIVAARGGRFDGKVVVGSPKPLAGLKVTAGDLKGEGGVAIPAAAVRIRYGIPWGRSDTPTNSTPRSATLLGALSETPLTEFPVSKAGAGAVVSVWVTVAVPPEARSGLYAGELRIEAKGEQPVTVPVTLDVQDWTVPPTQEFRTWVELVESPDTESVEYGAPMWGPEHMARVGSAMELIGSTGSRALHIPLICFTNYGASESLVRWVRKDANTFENDFTLLEQYLDLAEKRMGKPKMLILSLWDAYFRTTMTFGDDWWNKLPPEAQKSDFYLNLRKRGLALKEVQAKYGPGAPAVSFLDPATKKVDSDYMPPYAHPDTKAAWTALFKELRERLKKRGLEDTMRIGMLGDDWPTPQETQAIADITGGAPWISQSHNLMRAKIHDLAPVDYCSHVWSISYISDKPEKRIYGWDLPRLVCEFRRFDSFNAWPAATVFHWGEVNITGDQRGIGRCGGDLWPAVRDKAGNRSSRVGGRYPQSQWRNLEISSFFLAPGPQGPVATDRLEFFRLGLQEAEARIAIERALLDPARKAKLGAELVKKCEDTLNERTRYMVTAMTSLSINSLFPNYTDPKTRTLFEIGSARGNAWFLSTGWQGRSAKLFALAGEVEKKR